MNGYHIGRLGQIKIYIGKCFRGFIRERGWKAFISSFIIAVILGWVVGDKTFAVHEATKNGVFAMICGCIWTGLFNSIQSICRERAIIKREHKTGLHISSYVIAHMIYEFIICVGEAIIFTIVFDLFRDFPESGAIFGWTGFEFFISFVFIIFAADALGIMVSCIVKTENIAMTVMPFVLIIQLVLSGNMFTLPESADSVKELTISKWGLTAICTSADVNSLPTRDYLARVAEIEEQQKAAAQSSTESGYSMYDSGNEYMQEDTLSSGISSQNPANTVNTVPEFKNDKEYEHTPKRLLLSWGVLAGFSLIYGFIGIIFLEFVDKDKR